MRKLELLDNLEEKWKGCELCDLHRCRTKLVHWRGNPEARLFIIGEAPGAEEDKTGRPFVGPAGHMLDDVLKAAGLNPAEDVFVANMVACRPPGNRVPERPELKACARRLHTLLRIVKPSVLLLMGSVAARLAGVSTVKAFRGTKSNVDVLCYDGEVREWPGIVTYHPSFLLRNGGSDSEYYQQVVQDVKKAHSLTQQ